MGEVPGAALIQNPTGAFQATETTGTEIDQQTLTPENSGTGTVTSVTATDPSIAVSGTSTVAPTIATGTLDVIATQHPPAAAVPMNAKKITGLANGTAATDAAAFGQITTAGQLI